MKKKFFSLLLLLALSLPLFASGFSRGWVSVGTDLIRYDHTDEAAKLIDDGKVIDLSSWEYDTVQGFTRAEARGACYFGRSRRFGFGLGLGFGHLLSWEDGEGTDFGFNLSADLRYGICRGEKHIVDAFVGIDGRLKRFDDDYDWNLGTFSVIGGFDTLHRITDHLWFRVAIETSVPFWGRMKERKNGTTYEFHYDYHDEFTLRMPIALAWMF